MSKHFKATLQDLHERFGVTAADLTPEEIESLVFACRRIESPFSAVNAELMERPIYVCRGVYFWPLTAGAHVWLTECASKWWPDTSPFLKWARIYALANARNSDAFASLTSKAKARAAIVRCALGLVCHVREVNRAMEQAYGIDEYSAPRKSEASVRAQSDFAALVARLEVASGIAAESWLWGRSLRSMLKSYVELSELSAAAIGGKCDRAQIELDEAVENMARVTASIVERLTNEQGS